MKDFITNTISFSFDGKEWYNTSGFSHYGYAEPKEEITVINNFQQLIDLTVNNKFRNAQLVPSFWTGKNKVILSVYGKATYTIKEKTFKTIYLKYENTVCDYLPITKIASILKASDFIEYCNNKGLKISEKFL